jgi:hypothetical protein
VKIDTSHLNTYDGSIPASLVQGVSIVNDKNRNDAQAEEGSTNSRSFSSEPVSSISEMQSSFLYEDECESVPLKDLYDSLRNSIPATTPLSTAPRSSINRSIAMISGNRLVSSNDPHFFSWAFPTLFPFGDGTPNCERRERVSLKQFVKQALSVRSPSFRNSHPFQFTVFDTLRHFELLFSVKLRVRKVQSSTLTSLSNISVTEIQEAIHLKNSNSYIPDDHPAKPLMSAIRLVGARTKYSDLFKSNSRSEILSTIISSGPPALYITISPLDHRHIIAYKFANRTESFDLNSLPESLSNDQFRLRQAAQNPVGLAEFFHILISTILKSLFGGGENNCGIFGPLQHYYGMVEAKNRGTLHIHLVLWIHGTPNADYLFAKLNTDDEFKTALFKYLDLIIKTDLSEYPVDESDTVLPDRASRLPLLSPNDLSQAAVFHPRLQSAIQEYQTHSHTSSCFKNDKNKTRCRHKMPNKCHDVTHFVPATGEVIQRRAHPMINKFNPYLTSITNSNTDVSFLFRTHSSLAVMHYITMYITKSDDQVDNYYVLMAAAKQSLLDNPTTSTVTDLCPNQLSFRAFLLRMFNQVYKATQRPSNIVSSLLLDLPMCYKSAK